MTCDRNPFEPGDKVRWSTGFGYKYGYIIKLDANLAHIKGDTGPVVQVLTKDLSFACHNHGCPAANDVFDFAAAERDGYESGFYWARLGEIYEAGGPYYYGEGTAKLNPCRHVAARIKEGKENQRIWKAAWRKGQQDAMTDKIDWKKPVFTLDGREVFVACANYREYPDSKPRVQLRIKNNGSWGSLISVDPKTGVTDRGSTNHIAFTNMTSMKIRVTPHAISTTAAKPNVELMFGSDGTLIDVRKI